MFRSRALDVASRTLVSDAPLLLPRIAMARRLDGNLRQLRQALAPPRQGRRVRTPERRQQHPSECAAVCLAIALEHHGRHVPLSELRRACGVSRDGSDAANLVRAAQLFGLEARGFKKGLEALRNVQLPAVLFWSFDHFLVLEGLERGRFWLNDPACGRRSVDLEEFDRNYTGVVITLQPGPDFVRGGQLPPRWRWLGRRVRQQPLALAGVVASSLAAALLLGLLPAWLLPAPGPAGPWPAWWALAAAAPLLLAALSLQPLAQVLSRRLLRRTRRELQEHLLSLPDWVLQQHGSAELSVRLQQAPLLATLLAQQLWPTLPLLLASLLWGLLLLPLQPALSLMLWLGGGLCLLAIGRSESGERSRDASQRLAASRPAAVLRTTLQDPDTLKASAMERDLFLRWAGLEVLACREWQRLHYQRDLVGWLPKLLRWALPVALLALAVPPALHSPAGAALLVLAQGLAFAAALTLQRSQRLLHQWGEACAVVDGLQTVLEQPRDPLLLPPSQPLPAVLSLNGPVALALEQVSFGYVPVLPPLIENLDLRVEPGCRLAIVGGSASGKSTLVRLIAGLLQPSQGSVRLNGVPLLAWPRQQRLRAIAMVQQSAPLLACTVRENLSLWDPAISTAQLEEACEAAAILERIAALPQGFDTPLQEAGQNLSGGERQRLQLAQALLQKPSLLVLDEATSALDAVSEARVEQALRQLGCTQVVVAHRLSTVRDADEILVLEQGRIVQRGCHSTLIAEPQGAYARLLQDDDG